MPRMQASGLASASMFEAEVEGTHYIPHSYTSKFPRTDVALFDVFS